MNSNQVSQGGQCLAGLSAIRSGVGLTSRALAVGLGLNHTQVSKLENLRRPASAALTQRIADFFGCDQGDLLTVPDGSRVLAIRLKFLKRQVKALEATKTKTPA